MKLYTVIPIIRCTGKELPPRYDLRPMNHMAVCNFMHACRTSQTDYRIHEWPQDVPQPGVPCLASGYKQAIDKGEDHFAEAVETKEFIDALLADASAMLKKTRNRLADELGIPASGHMGLTPDAVKFHPEYRAIKTRFEQLKNEFTSFHRTFMKQYAKRWRTELHRRRQERQPQPINIS